MAPPTSDPDSDILQQVAQGDQDALQALYAKHGLALLNYILSMIGSRQLAEDTLQEVMVAVWQGASAYKPLGSVQAWMFGIARRQALKTLRKNPTVLPLHENHIQETDTLQNQVAERLTLTAAIRQLPEAEQITLELVYYRGLSLQETADRLNIPLNTVKTRLHRARKRLRVALTKEENHHV